MHLHSTLTLLCSVAVYTYVRMYMYTLYACMYVYTTYIYSLYSVVWMCTTMAMRIHVHTYKVWWLAVCMTGQCANLKYFSILK